MGVAACIRCWVMSTSLRRLVRMTDLNVAACQELGLTMSAKKTKAMRMRSKSSTASNTLRFETKGQHRKLKLSYPSYSPLAEIPLHSHRSNRPLPRLNTYVVGLVVRPARHTLPRLIYPNVYFDFVPPRPSSSISSTKPIMNGFFPAQK